MSTRFQIAAIAGALALALGCQSPEERLSEHLERAEDYFDEELWNEAKIEFLNVLQLDPENAEAHFKMGEILWRLGEFAEGRWQYKEAGRLQSDNLEYRLRLAQVESLFQRISDAMDHIAFVLEKDPEHVDALLLRGTLNSMQGDLDGFLVDIDRALELDPNQPIGLRLKARGMESKGELEAAEVAYKRLIKVDDTVANRTMYALFLQARRRMDESLEQLRLAIEAAEDESERTRARVVVASFHMNRGNFEEAEEELLKAREEDPDNENLLTSIARFYSSQGDPAKALEMLEMRAQQSPDNPQPLLALGEFHRRSGDLDKALEAFDRALAVDPQDETGRLRKAEILREQGQGDPEMVKRARGILNEVLEENPGSVRGLFTQGKFLLMDGQYEEAAAKLRRVIDEQPRSNAHLLLGVSYVRMGQAELARSEFLRAVQLDADNQMARVQLSAIYQSMGEHELAVEEATAALRGRNRFDYRALLVLAEANRSLNRAEQTVKALDRIPLQRLEGEEARTARVNVARLYRSVNEFDKAQSVLEAGMEGQPDDMRLLVEQVLADVAARDPHGALARLNTAIEEHGDSSLLRATRGRVYMGFTRNGQLVFPSEAEADLKKAIELEPGRADAYASLAQLYRQTGRLQDAVDTYAKAAQKDPTNPEAHLVLGTLYEQAGRLEEAVKEYEVAVRLDSKQAIARNNLAWLLAQTGDGDAAKLDRALRLAQDARELMPTDPSVADTLGWVMLKREAPTAAISLFREAIEGYKPGAPERSIVRYHLAKAYEKNGEPARAIEELERALAEAEAFPDRSKAEELLEQLKAS